LESEGDGPDTAVIGKLGEKIARRHLYAHGCKILYSNFRAPGGGEVDIVCRHGKVLVFAEVKTRTSSDFGRPADAVNLSKQRLIARGAQHWLKLLDQPEVAWRCDIVEVILNPDKKPAVTWIQSAFLAEEARKRRKWT
jgi:putative endonuclease